MMYGQFCAELCNRELLQSNNLQLSQNLSYPIPFGSARSSFGNGWVDGWFASHSTPHHTQYIPGVSCNSLWTIPNGTETNCFITNFSQTEGIFTDIQLTNDQWVTYHLSYGIQALNCFNTFIPDHLVNVRLAKGLVPHTLQVSSPLPNVPSFSLNQHLINTFDNMDFCVHFNVPTNTDYDQLWFYTEYINMPPHESGYTSLYNIKLHCTTEALSDINYTGSGLSYQFSAVNASVQSEFMEYLWDFGDGNFSTQAAPAHLYASPGAYTVCLDILDSNKCCGRRCVQLTADCALPNAAFTMSGVCPSYEMTPDQTAGITSYQWSVSGGTLTGANNQNASVIFTANGTYTITLTVTDACGNTASSTQQVVVDCVQPPVSCVDQSSCISIGTGPASVTLLSDLLQGPNPVIPSTQWFFSYYVKDLCISLQGTLIIDVAQVVFENTQWFNGPGATIQINDFSLWGGVWFIGSTMQGCDQMWRGIVLPDGIGSVFNTGSGIALRGTTIRDAYRAVELGNRRGISAVNSYFLENYTGVFSGGQNQKSIVTEFRGNHFRSERNMLPPYPGQPQWSARGYSGIEMTNVDQLNVVSSSSDRNEFLNLRWGIRLSGTNVRVSNALFVHDDFNGTEWLNSTGINIQPLGAVTEISDSRFEGQFFGINLHTATSANVKIKRNQFLNLRTLFTGAPTPMIALRAFNLNASKLYIDNNRIEQVTDFGIDVQSNLLYLSVSNNRFISQGINFDPLRIRDVRSNGHIHNNIFQNVVPNNRPSVLIKDCALLSVRNNEFSGLTGSNAKAFEIIGSRFCTFSNNSVLYEGTGFQVLGSQSATNNVYCCNGAFNTGTLNYSFDYFAENGMTAMRQNNLNTLRLSGNIGPQTSAGNLWTNPGNRGWLVNGNSAKAEFNAFRVDDAVTGSRPGIIVPVAIAGDWFPPGGTHYDCLDRPDCGIIRLPGGDGDPEITDPTPDPDFDNPHPDPVPPDCDQLSAMAARYIAGPGSDTAAFNLFKWQFERILVNWKRLYGFDYTKECVDGKDSILIYLPEVEEWYDTEKVRHHVRFPDVRYRPDLSDATAQLLHLSPVLAGTAWEPSAEDISLDSLYGAFSEANIRYIQAVDASIQQMLSDVAQLLQRVNALPVPFEFLEDRKKVWQAELRVFTDGIQALSHAEWNDIRAIADKCYRQYGQAVFEAQNLLRWIGEEVESDPECTAPEIRSRATLPMSSVKVYPNPATDVLHFEWTVPGDISHIRLTDISGKMVMTVNPGSQSGSADLNIIHLNPGIYLYDLTHQNGKVTKGKVVVIK